MKKVVSGAGLLAVVSVLLAVTAAAEGERTPSVMAVMHKQYTVTRAPFVLIKKELESDAPDWEKVRDATRRFVVLAAVLEKNEPKRGGKESWKRFTGLHSAEAKAMDEAAEARDTEAVRVVHRRLEASCKACHDAHRFRGRG